jgi:hypothetical protein
MKPRWKLAVAVPLASAMMFAQSLVTETPRLSDVRAYTYTGNIVNANCYQAAEIVNRNSRSYAPMATANAFTPGSRKPVLNASPKRKKEILRHCSVNPGTTQFALLNDDGNFLKLDERGNLGVASKMTVDKAGPRSRARKIRMLVTGSVDGEKLIVQSLSKM